MRISARTRYGLNALIYMALQGMTTENDCVAVINLSEQLNISKIYLEQVFALLKRGGIVQSVKGAGGGYFLAKPPAEISAFSVFSVIETAMFEEPKTPPESDDYIGNAMNNAILRPLDEAIKETLSAISLESIADSAKKNSSENIMYYL